MTGMTDIHCHVLPGVDDGAKNTDESIKMLSFMYDEGIRKVILTPHYHRGHMETGIERIRDRFGKLRAAAKQTEKINEMDLYLGSEIYYYPSVVEWLEEGSVLTLADSNYVLLEFGFTMDKRIIHEGVSSVINSGYRPVIAHIERYESLYKDLKSVDALLEKGAYIQINSEALHERYKIRSFAKKLLKERMVHFLATDAHNMRHRSPRISDAARYIAKHYGEDYCRRLVIDNPAKVINNDYISG